MSPFGNRIKSPEEVELEKKRAELKALKERGASLEAAYAALKSDIRAFERMYESALGSRIAILEDLEWQIGGLLGSEQPVEPVISSSATDAFSYFHHRTDLLDDDPESDPDPHAPPKNLKSLYRAVAKAIHPDLAQDEEQRRQRQDLMAVANNAYEMGDRKVLEDIFYEWDKGPEPTSELDVALELVRVIRDIARAQENNHALVRQIEELKSTDIYNFKERVEEASVDGLDLLAEMAAALDIDISRARNRLAVLRGDVSEVGPGHTPLETRIIRFPADTACGTLFERGRNSLDFRDWRRIGVARGAKEVFLDKSIRLDIKCVAHDSLYCLSLLQPDDLQALFLYEADDGSLEHITHLSGLEELYLSNTSVSDAGMPLLKKLAGLKRLYIYHTPVTDFGLADLAGMPSLRMLTCSGTAVSDDGFEHLRQLMPWCKVVNFKWRYE